jgi:hypothetical protein
MPIRRRLLFLTSLSAFGGLLFAPFVLAGMRSAGNSVPPSLSKLAVIFFAASAVVAGLCSWAGLRLADRAQLPMPILRSWDQRVGIPPGNLRGTLFPAVLAGLAAGILIGGVVHLLPIPVNPGTLIVRLLTVFFAATVTEVVVHLFAMSALIVAFRRPWLAIFLSSVVFVLIFHSGQMGSLWMTALVVGTNFVFSLLTGWMYFRYGFEAALLAHAIAHLLALAWN